MSNGTIKNLENRRLFIGGSDARIIMGVPKIIAAIPAELTAATAARLQEATKLLRRLGEKLQHRETRQRTVPSDEKSLSDVFARARRQFGRVDIRKVVESA
jgi:hypothetical protein